MATVKSKQKISEFLERVLEVRRVARVVAGGKRLSFRAIVVVGNKKGKVGIGIGKGLDVSVAVLKAKRQAEKNVFEVPLKDGRTIPYEVEGKYSSSYIRLKPAKPSHGLVAGGSVRIVLELAGIKDVTAKILGRTTSKLNNAMATIKALKNIEKIEEKSDNMENKEEK
jgi:small subunit ribosomal protein S5